MSAADAAEPIPDAARLMIAGFVAVGSPERITDALVARGARDLTVIENDTARSGLGNGNGKLAEAGCVARATVSHIGTNPVTQWKMLAGELEVELVPRETLAERIRAGGVGLGTLAAEGKRVIDVEGRSYLLERLPWADVALPHAREADHEFHPAYKLRATNVNPTVATAADCAIAEAVETVPVGVIPPNAVRMPGLLVHYLQERAH